MRVSTLSSPGLLSMGIKLRTEAAKAISAVEISAGRGHAGAAKSPHAFQLNAFFTECAAAVAAFIETTVPAVAAKSIGAANPKRIVLTYDEGLDPKSVPAVTDFAITTQAKAVTKVTIDGPFVYLDVATPFVAGAVNVAYTQGAIKLKDVSGNLAASFTAAAVTNGIV